MDTSAKAVPARVVPVVVTEDMGATLSVVNLSSNGKTDAFPKPCVCLQKVPEVVVSGTHVRNAPFTHDVLTASSVVAAIKHVIAPVCTWQQSDIDDMCVEGSKLALHVMKQCATVLGTDKVMEHHNVFGGSG